MKKETIAGLIAIAAIVVAVIFAGCVGSPYHVEYSIEGGYGGPQLLVNVSGPADDLAIILTDPEEDTHIAYISKEKMIDNFESVKVPICRWRDNPPVGTYKLVVKTVTPEKVVYESEKKFKPAIVLIEHAEVGVKSAGPSPTLSVIGYVYGWLQEYNITVKNEGELPIIIDEIEIIVDHLYWYPSGYKERVGLYISGETEIKYSGIYQPITAPITDVATIKLYSKGELVASSEAEIIVEY